MTDVNGKLSFRRTPHFAPPTEKKIPAKPLPLREREVVAELTEDEDEDEKHVHLLKQRDHRAPDNTPSLPPPPPRVDKVWAGGSSTNEGLAGLQ